MTYLTHEEFRRDYRTIQAIDESDPVDMFDDVKSLTTAELQALLDSFERS